VVGTGHVGGGTDVARRACGRAGPDASRGRILERLGGAKHLVLVGVRRGGEPVAELLRSSLERLEGTQVPLGTLDITLYRDDAATALPNPRIGPSNIPCSLNDRQVVLVDDVIGTGRTVRAALDALMDYGRPRCIQLAVVVDRGGRELPIAPDYVVRSSPIPAQERVDVWPTNDGLVAVLQPYGSPSLPPRGVF
jgi:pyrimidine operon attenuation protein / uracil phosphoribosyltransferase